jgi:glycogen phosphorylase/synthase
MNDAPRTSALPDALTLFEVSWEVCNKVGGIHTVLSTKARTMVEKLGDRYITLGPWLLSESTQDVPFDEDPSYRDFSESCREMGIPVRVGRWRVPGRPRAILIEFSQSLAEKDEVLASLWEDFGVDSIQGGWDYMEPVLFGWAAGRVIEKWWEEFIVPDHGRAIVHAHEWMTASSMLYLKQRVPAMGTVFTTHATILGRTLSSHGHSPEDGLGDQTPEELAEYHGILAKHSLESVSAREADAFTTVSEITAHEAEILLHRTPEPVLPNGIDVAVLDEMAGPVLRDDARQTLTTLASRFLGESVADAAFLCVSGRYEFRNKGIDILLDAIGRMNRREGPPLLLFILVPAGNSGVRSELIERLEGSEAIPPTPLGITTHNLFDEGADPVHEYAARFGLTNAPGSRIRVIQIPIYLDDDDGFLGLPYGAVLRAMDLSCFPSFYEPWGYTPQESIALGVPTITSDYAGFGRWAEGLGLDHSQGVTVLSRRDRDYQQIVEALDDELEAYLQRTPDPEAMYAACRATAHLTEWSDQQIIHYETAYRAALAVAHRRLDGGRPRSRRAKKPLTILPTPEGQHPRLIRFDVSATLPPELAGLERLSRNCWWGWDPVGRELFKELSPISWEISGHNPVRFLQRVFPEDLVAKARDKEYVAKLEGVLERFDAYLAEPRGTGPAPHLIEPSPLPGASPDHPIAYFCAEFGIHESLRLYSGGLGILAGDHLKSASDLNLPFLAVGLFYRMGYLSQRITPSGDQVEEDVENDPNSLPLERVRDGEGRPLVITLGFPGRELQVGAWRLNVGRVPLYLLDTDLPANRPEDRAITRNLYGGDQQTRIQQEIVLGRGGIRLLRELGITPAVYHMNEGHPAFLTIERVRGLTRREGLTFEEAHEFVRASTLFTTHTPVPAGHDCFGEELVRRYFSDVSDALGIPWDRFYGMGRCEERNGEFNMTYLAMNFSSFCNGVSKLHGVASQDLLRSYWPRLLRSEVPVATITNGIHLPTWTHPAIARSLGVVDRPIRGEDFAELDAEKSAGDIWRARQRLKDDLIHRVILSLRRSSVNQNDSPLLLDRIVDGLRGDALLIGFARRFAPYKRAHLLFQNRDRILRLLNDEKRPLRILFAGKAHPADGVGKGILRSIYELSRTDEFAGKLIFVENYDMALARSLVQGVDVWLNNPTRMLEASGTSGMKAAANGGLNLSIGDGWWPEAYDGRNGWLIGGERVYENSQLQDQLDSATLYRLLEEEVMPRYFERDEAGMPARWMEMVMGSLRTIPPVFNTDRMVSEYFERGYRDLGAGFVDLLKDRRAKLKTLAQDLRQLRRRFAEVRIVSAEIADLGELHVGDPIAVRLQVDLAELRPEDVVVELLTGSEKGHDDLEKTRCSTLAYCGKGEGSIHIFEGSLVAKRSGRFGYGLRVRAIPRGGSPLHSGDLVLWA